MQRIAVYPGSFDPPTFGHLDIIERAARQFDEVIVAIGINPSKSAFLSVEERIGALTAVTSDCKNVRIGTFSGLLIHYAESVGSSTLVRGLRATSDFDYEFQIAMANRRLNPAVETVFLMTKWEHSYLSSSIVREVAQLGGDFSQFIPPSVVPFVSARLEKLKT